MERNEYLSYRNKNDFNIIYEFYKEKYNTSKFKKFLNANELANSLHYGGYSINTIMNNCISHFDEKFNIMKVYVGENLIALL